MNLRLLAAGFVFFLLSTVVCCSAQTTTFFDLSPYDGSEGLIDFDNQGVRPFDELDRINSVEFNLVDEGTLNDAFEGPTGASSGIAREFAPLDGPVFINFQFGVDLELRFDNPINTASAEIRTGSSTTEDETLTFELYNGGNFISSVTVDERSGSSFFFYGVQSTDAFDRLIIRVRPDNRFGIDNLRYAFVASELPGDVNLDGDVDFLDISPFIALLSTGDYQIEGDINLSGEINFLDIALFIDLLSNQ